MQTGLVTLDWVVIALYLVGTVAIGLAFSRRASQDTAEFFLGGRRMAWWLAGTSMVATSFSADTPLYVTGLVRSAGIWKNWIWWALAVSHVFSLVFLARIWRRAGVATDVGLAEIRYSGPSARFLRAFRGLVLGLVVNPLILGWSFLAEGKILSVIMGIPLWWGLAIGVALTLAYASASGLWGVVVTDLPQFALALGGAVVLAVAAVWKVGGLAELTAALRAGPDAGRLALFPAWPEAGLTTKAFWQSTAGTLAILLSVQWWAWKNSDGGGALIQRMNACRDERHSFLAVLWFCVAHYCLRPWPWILVALASLLLLPAGTPGEEAYPRMMLALLPAGLLGLLVAALLAAFMSTVDTYFNLSAAYLVKDVYEPFVAPGRTEQHYLYVSRLVTVLVALAGLAVAALSSTIRDLFHFMLSFGAGVGAVYILRWFWWRINAASEIAGLASSAALALAFQLVPALKAGFPFPLNVPAIAAISGVVWLAATFLTPPVEAARLDAFYRRVRPLGWWGPVARRADPALVPGPAEYLGAIAAWIGGSVMLLALTLAIGWLLLGQTLTGLAALCVAAAGGVWLQLGLHAGRARALIVAEERA